MGAGYDHLEDQVYDDQALAAATATIKATPGRLRSIVATNRNASTRYLLLFDTTSATTPIRAAFPIPPLSLGGTVALGTDQLGKAGLLMATGITFGISTASNSYSAATSTEHDIFARYI